MSTKDMQLSVGPVIRVCVCVCDRGRGSRASLLHGERLASVVNGFTIVMSVVLARRRAGPPFRLRGCPSMCPAGIKQHTRPPPALIHLRDSLYSDATKNSARKLLLKTCNVCLIKIFDCGSIHFTISSGIGNWHLGTNVSFFVIVPLCCEDVGTVSSRHTVSKVWSKIRPTHMHSPVSCKPQLKA